MDHNVLRELIWNHSFSILPIEIVGSEVVSSHLTTYVRISYRIGSQLSYSLYPKSEYDFILVRNRDRKLLDLGL